MNLQSISRYISLILRHKPEVINITLNEHGWANVEELIQGIAKNNPGFNKEILEEIVRTDNKQRYSFNDDKTLIRANQGHSIPVDVELEEKEPPRILYLGKLTVYEVKKLGYEVGLPTELIEKIPIDGLCGKTDEDNLGFPYEVLDRYLRTGEIDDLDVKVKIDLMHKRCLFKSEKIPVFNPELKVEAA